MENKIKEWLLGSAGDFENKVYGLLLECIAQQEDVYRELVLGINYNLRIRADFYLPNGLSLLNEKQPIIIEVKYSLTISNYYSQLHIANLWLEQEENKDKRYWLIYGHTKLDLPNSEDIRIRFISIERFEYLIECAISNKKCPHRAKKFHKNRHHKVSIRTDTSHDKSKTDLISIAKKSLIENNCSFVLGAGISIPEGAGSWNSLLRDLLASSDYHSPLGDDTEVDFPKSDCYDINEQCGYSSLITARYILERGEPDYTKAESAEEYEWIQEEYRKSNEQEFVRHLRKSLYREKPAGYIKENTPIYQIARIIDKYKFESVFTLNYDEYLEEELLGLNCAIEPFVSKGAVKKGLIPIYHIHGIVTRADKASAVPVLSEEKYHKLYAEAFEWSNVELLRALTRNTCFFVGLSMTDPNLRRLLDIAKSGDLENRHFVFLRKEPLKKNSPNPEKDKKHWEILEQQFLDMGLNILWYDYYADKPNDHTDLVVQLKNFLTE